LPFTGGACLDFGAGFDAVALASTTGIESSHTHTLLSAKYSSHKWNGVLNL